MNTDPAGGGELGATMERLGREALAAARVLARAPRQVKDTALEQAAAALRGRAGAILEANARDMDAARARGLGAALLDRLELDAKRVEAMALGLESIALLPDPIGAVIAEWTRPNGLVIQRVRVPLGVIAIIYESRPNVTADAGGLCLKSGNAVILRPGSRASTRAPRSTPASRPASRPPACRSPRSSGCRPPTARRCATCSPA